MIDALLCVDWCVFYNYTSLPFTNHGKFAVTKIKNGVKRFLRLSPQVLTSIFFLNLWIFTKDSVFSKHWNKKYFSVKRYFQQSHKIIFFFTNISVKNGKYLSEKCSQGKLFQYLSLLINKGRVWTYITAMSAGKGKLRNEGTNWKIIY